MINRIVVSIPLESAIRVLEGILPLWVKPVKYKERERVYIYRVFHRVSETIIWDCGAIRLGIPESIPGPIQNNLTEGFGLTEFQAAWFEVLSATHEGMSQEEQGHNALIFRQFLDAFPMSLKFSLPQPTEEWKGEFWNLVKMMEANPQQYLVQNDAQMDHPINVRLPKIRAQRGRPVLTSSEVKDRQAVVEQAEAKRREHPAKPWKIIAEELNIGASTLRSWRKNLKRRGNNKSANK